MKKPLFSIIIPTLNEAKYLPHLLKDLSHQSFHDFEVIVVDGHSEDQTVAKAKKYTNSFSKLTIIASPKRHVCVQRNLGAQYAQSDVLIFMDADNRLPSYFLQGIKYRLETDPADLACTYFEPDTNKKSDLMVTNVLNKYLDFTKSIGRPLLMESCTIVKKVAFNKVGGFDPNLNYAEGQELALRIIHKGYTYQVYKDPIYKYSMRRVRKYGLFYQLKAAIQYEIAKKTHKKSDIDKIRAFYPMKGGDSFNTLLSSKEKKQISQLISKLTT